jgi:hypothetical protein
MMNMWRAHEQIKNTYKYNHIRNSYMNEVDKSHTKK